MKIPGFIMRASAKALAAGYREVFEGKYKPGFPAETSTDLKEIRRTDIKDSPIRLAHISDLHIGRHSVQKLEDLKRTLESIQPHFLVISGDIVHFPTTEFL